MISEALEPLSSAVVDAARCGVPSNKVKGEVMRTYVSRMMVVVTVAVGLSIGGGARAGTWTPLTNQPTFLNPPTQCSQFPNGSCVGPGWSLGGVFNATLLTDGSILFVAGGVDDDFLSRFLEYKLTPDVFGSYVNGTWTQVASLPDAESVANPDGWGPLDLASAVLPDGRVIYEGGEYRGVDAYGDLEFGLSDRGAIYDPVADAWTDVPPPNFDNLYPAVPPMLPGFNDENPYPRYPLFTSTLVHPIGDSQSVVLPNGTFMIAGKLSRQQALLDAGTLSWTLTGTGKADVNSEEGWTLLPNGKVLTVDCDLDYWFGLTKTYAPGNSELYDPKTGQWSSAGNTVNILTSFPEGEMGPALLMPDGVVWAMAGDGGTTSFYDSYKNKWSAGPSFPTIEVNGQTVPLSPDDMSAALLPTGNVLVATAPPDFSSTKFFEFDGRRFIPAPGTPNSSFLGGANFLLLPSGQVLEFDWSSDIEIYTPSPLHEDRRYAPRVTEAPSLVSPGKSYEIRGVLLNGISQGAMEGDDAQMATNYPLVRITNLRTKHVFYSRTHAFSSMAVANPEPVSARMDVPAGQERGPSLLEVVTNGIASNPVPVFVR
jgi:hypothetical protein